MRSRTLVMLCVIVCLLGLAVFYTLRGDRSGEQTRMGKQLFSDLPVNAVTQIHLNGPDGEVRLKKGPSVWEVENRFGYPADFDKIADLVKKIRDLKVGRTFTGDETVRERLALLDPQAAGKLERDKKGTRVVLLSDAGDRPVADILLGKARQGGSGSGGHHLMLMGSRENDTVYVVDQSFRFLEANAADWLSKDLVDVAPDDVQQVACHDLSSGDLIYRLLRSEKGKEPTIEGPDEKEIGDPAKIERVFGALSGLTIDGVAGGIGAVDFAGLENPRRFEYRLFDGGVYILETGKRSSADGEEHYLSMTTAYHPAQAADGGAPAAGRTAPDDGAHGAPSETREKMQRLNDRLHPWIYTISTWKYEGLVYDRKGLLQQKG